MRVLWCMGFVAAVSVGCGDKADDDTSGSGVDTGSGGGDTGEPTACESLTPEACGERTDCTGINGRSMQDDGEGGLCVDFGQAETALGCMTAGMGCGDAETLAADPSDPSTCWWFSSTCVPSGWTACETSMYGECAR